MDFAPVSLTLSVKDPTAPLLVLANLTSTTTPSRNSKPSSVVVATLATVAAAVSHVAYQVRVFVIKLLVFVIRVSVFDKFAAILPAFS